MTSSKNKKRGKQEGMFVKAILPPAPAVKNPVWKLPEPVQVDQAAIELAVHEAQHALAELRDARIYSEALERMREKPIGHDPYRGLPA